MRGRQRKEFHLGKPGGAPRLSCSPFDLRRFPCPSIIQDMEISGWNERYRSGKRAIEDLGAPPTRLLMETAKHLEPGRALDLACGTGRNALWLAEHGWSVTAVDGSPVA